ncbi:hypothetical protein AIOL_003042 [Candidatus Rhodobacter oscarellae]|uniref:Uncharacterized protein n=1 Tax=Candidatus Rhodobacter oscarellae TaxID=1675527 RepID=A0A0J9E5R3_9RHOB|nr:tetratricopeptide repeat protein [Candidatus Rhodobacter lobularis]KMW58072.1 hypothetical protein AIOL_003042 [Candidatus Rhodobacter lobularis]
MGALQHIFKRAVTVFLLCGGISQPIWAQEATLEDLLAQLADPATENWQQIERQIRTEWSRSGSAAMDLLLQRGEEALEASEFDVAFEHFSALTDHAPDFAEGWNLRATALFQQGYYGPALEDLRRALALNPQHFGALTGLAVILQDTQLFDEALEVWHMVEAMHPHRPEMRQAIEALEQKVGGARL